MEHNKNLSSADIDGENWTPVKSYNGIYSISSFCRIKRHRISGDRILRQSKVKSGYLCVKLYRGMADKKTFYVHRLFAEAFVTNPLKKEMINHKDGVKTNNTIDNIEWCTRSENIKHAFDIGLNFSANNENHYNHKLSNEDVNKIRIGHDGVSSYRLGKIYGVSKTQIMRIRKFQSRVVL